MRIAICLILLVAVAACGSQTEQNNATAAGPAEPNEATPTNAAMTQEPESTAAGIAAGMWELSSEVIALQSFDPNGTEGAPRPGTQTTEMVCVGEGRPPTALFAEEGYQCEYDDYEVREGRITVTMQCAREGLSGPVSITARGSFADNSLRYSREVQTDRNTDGHLQINSGVTARHAGECQPGGE